MENELCRSRTTRWADVEAEEDDLDMSLPVERAERAAPSIKETTSCNEVANRRSAEGQDEKGDSRKKLNGCGFSAGGGGGSRQVKKTLNLSREAPFIAKISNLDYTLQVRDIQDFFRRNGISDVRIKLPTRNGNNEGVATIEFSSFDDFSNSVNNLDGMSIGSRSIRFNVVSNKSRMEDRGGHKGSSMTRGGASSQSSGPQGGSGFVSGGGGKGARGHAQSNRDLSPDFSTVRRVDAPTRQEDSGPRSTLGGASRAVGSSNKDGVGGSIDRSKTASRPRSKGGDHQSQSNLQSQSQTSIGESMARGQNSPEYEKGSNPGSGRRWNSGSSREKGRSKGINSGSKGSGSGPGSGSGSGSGRGASKESGAGMSRGSGARDGLDSRRGGGKGPGGGASSVGGSSRVHTSAGGSNSNSASESKVLYTSKGKAIIQKGRQTAGIETRNRFAALDES